MTRSTSCPLWVRQCPTSRRSSRHDACLRISPTTKVSNRCPNSARAAGSRRASLSVVMPSRYAARPESTTWSFGECAARDRSVRPQAGSRRTRNSASRSTFYIGSPFPSRSDGAWGRSSSRSQNRSSTCESQVGDAAGAAQSPPVPAPARNRHHRRAHRKLLTGCRSSAECRSQYLRNYGSMYC